MATSSPTRDYDAIGDYLETSDTSTYNFTTADFTVLIWGYSDSNAAYKSMIANQDSPGSAGWNMRSSEAGNGVINFRKGTTAVISSSLTVDTGAWNGFACIVDNGVNVQFVKVTLTTNSTDTVASATNITSAATSLRIGNEHLGNGYDGALNHAQIFNRKLSYNECVNALRAPGSVTNGLIGYWPGYGQITAEPDLSVTGSDGTVTGTGGTRTESCPAIPVLPFIT